MAETLSKIRDSRKAAPPKRSRSVLSDLRDAASAAAEGYWNRLGRLQREGLAQADQGARQVRGGNVLEGGVNMLMGPANYVSSWPMALIPTEQEVYGARDLPEDVKPFVAGGLAAIGAFLPGNKKGMGPVAKKSWRAPQYQEVSPKPNVGYHGTVRAFDEFKPPDDADFMLDRAIGTHIAKDPEISNSFVMERVNGREVGVREGGHLRPVDLPNDYELLPIEQPKFDWAVGERAGKDWQNIPSDQSVIERMVMTEAFKRDPEILARYLTEARAVPAADASRLARDLVSSKTVTLPVDGQHTLDSFVKNFGGKPYNDADRAAAVRLARQAWQEQGYKGLRYTNTSPMEMATATDPTSYVVFDPADIKSRFAKPSGIIAYHGSPHTFDRFDKRKSKHGDVAFFSTKEGTAKHFTRGSDTGSVGKYAISGRVFDPSNASNIADLSAAIEKNFSQWFPGALYGPESAKTWATKGDWGVFERPGVQKWLKSRGYDAWKFREGNENGLSSVAVFNPNLNAKKVTP